ncbi:hypothetical protein [Mycobacteroides sp. CBMA 271]|uniref:hypothetical protein n=1 Tax=Mycobacteroides sp. CBMA 271 TaxID=2606608 RepID=UPI001396BAE6|nr:hypothetical protein [Mycobacteroides sp. CBMA 271]
MEMLNLRTIQKWDPRDFQMLTTRLSERAASSEGSSERLLEIRRPLDSYSGQTVDAYSQRFKNGAAELLTESINIGGLVPLTRRITDLAREYRPGAARLYKWANEVGANVNDDDGTITLPSGATPLDESNAANYRGDAVLMLRSARAADTSMTEALQLINSQGTSKGGAGDGGSSPVLDVDPRALREIANATISLENSADEVQKRIDQGAGGLSSLGDAWAGMSSYEAYRAFAATWDTDWLSGRRRARAALLAGLASGLFVASSLFENRERASADRFPRLAEDQIDISKLRL